MYISYRQFFVYIVKRTYRHVCILYRYRHLYRQCIRKNLKTCIYVYIQCIWNFWNHVYVHVYMIYRQPWILKTCKYVYKQCIWNLTNVIYAVYEISKISVYIYIYSVYEIYFICLYDVYIHTIYTKTSLKMSISYRHIDTQGCFNAINSNMVV